MKPIIIGPGIEQHGDRVRVRASVGSGRNKVQATPAWFVVASSSKSTWQAEFYRQKMKLKDEHAKAGKQVVRGLVSGDIQRYLKLVEPLEPIAGQPPVEDSTELSKRLYQERTTQLAWWCEHFGTKRRADITGLELQEALKTLRRSASTKNKYRQAFSALWTRLDPDAKNPFDSFEVAKEPDPKPRDVPYEFIKLMLAYVGKGAKQTRAFLHVEAYTPVTRAQLQEMERHDVNWKTGVITRPKREKGEGQPEMMVELTAEGLEAFKMFDTADCWGKEPSRSSIRRILITARDKAVAQLERDGSDIDLTRARTMTPYALRHSFATFVANRVDPRVAQKLLGHADFKTTEGYIQSAIPTLVAAASADIKKAFAALPKAEPVVPVVAARKPVAKRASAGRS